jgi:GT2 family glycosyltransferase
MMGGEDIDLAWKVKKAGWQSAFAGDAVVYHRVFPRSAWRAVFNYREFFYMFHVWPLLLRKHSQFKKILYMRIFLSRHRAYFGLFLLSVALGLTLHPLFYAFTAPYAYSLVRVTYRGRALSAYHRGIATLFFLFIYDTFTFVLLLSGSMRRRILVL